MPSSRAMLQPRKNIVIDKYNFIANYATGSGAQNYHHNFRLSQMRNGMWPVDEAAVPASLFEPSVNYTTQAAQPLPPPLPSLLVPISAGATNGSSSTTSSSSTTNTTRSSITSTASTHHAAHPSATSATLSNSSATSSQSSALRHTTPPRPNDTVRSNEVVQALYKIALPSSLRKTASRKAMAAENDELHERAASGDEGEEVPGGQALDARSGGGGEGGGQGGGAGTRIAKLHPGPGDAAVGVACEAEAQQGVGTAMKNSQTAQSRRWEARALVPVEARLRQPAAVRVKALAARIATMIRMIVTGKKQGSRRLMGTNGMGGI
ncbi:hypothetical protein DFH09DRAFT_1082067 [Mycena vulgaris]|nr:hypothetical protein DFH09DRAFT_1082067 [Mycena vulgaris]